eukprot:m.1639228 g.1639228  ORF g.1639228 m.1639228 type:complete len:339 (+) comp34000_c0_seq1:170-1186(+)
MNAKSQRSAVVAMVQILGFASFSRASLYGMNMMGNGPLTSSLVQIDEKTGKVELVGKVPPQKELVATGDLDAIDAKRDVYYFLGDSSAGAGVVGISMSSGKTVCNVPVPLREIGFVGFGQSMDYDDRSDTLIISGIATRNATVGHSVLRGTPGALCGGKYTLVGHFQFATEVPMLHSSTLDAAGQRLFLDLSVDKTTVAVGVIDLKTAAVIKTIKEGTPPVDALVGIHYNAADKSLYAVMPNNATGPNLIELNPDTEEWTITLLASPYPVVGGNDASLSTYDPVHQVLYVLLGAAPQAGQEPALHVAQVDLRVKAIVDYSPALQKVGLGVVLMMSWTK